MSFVRRLALHISRFVVRYASPGSKEWAEGLAQEVAFIENDWRALRWALGGTLVLLDRREASISTLDEAFEAAQSFFEKQASQTTAQGIFVVFGAFVALLFIVSVPWLPRIGSFPRLTLQIGFSIALVAAVYAAYRALASRQRELDRPLGRYEAVVKYRDRLKRLYKAQHSWENWFLDLAILLSSPILILMTGGRSEFAEFFFSLHGLIALLPFAVIWMQAHLQDRKSARRIANLDALLSRGVEGIS